MPPSPVYARRPDTIVLINYHSDEEGAERTLETVRSLGAQGSCYQADVAEADDVAEIQLDSTDYGRPFLTTLVNNVVRIVPPSGGWRSAPTTSNGQLRANLAFRVLDDKVIRPSHDRSEKGSHCKLVHYIRNQRCSAGLFILPQKLAWQQSQLAVAAELGQHGIRVNAVAPGNIDTEMTRSAGADVVQWSIETTPLGRLGATHEVAEAVEFLEDSAL